MELSFYLFATILLELMMLTMVIHVIRYSGFNRRQKKWFILTFVSVMICAAAEYAVHCGAYDRAFALPLTVLTVFQFSLSPLLAVFFAGALGRYRMAERALWIFALNVVTEIVSAPFGWIFYFSEEGYFRGRFFFLYELYYLVALLYLLGSMIVTGRRFRNRDSWTIAMIFTTLVAGILPMMLFTVHIAYISIGICACLCYIYYNDLVQEDVQAELIANQQRVTEMQTHTISGLASLIESRDTETGEHISRTSAYVRTIAEKAREAGVYADQIDDQFIERLYTLSPLHDVGKIVVPDRILKKPDGLTPEEYEQMKTHATAGGRVVRQILKGIADEEQLQFASDMATCHHERWDGSGYPAGLAGEQIPLCARIMAIADVYDALISERCYKQAIPPEEAFEIIRQKSGSHFDPKLVQIFLDNRELFR